MLLSENHKLLSVLTLAARKRARTKSAQNRFLYCLVPTAAASAFVFQID
jgi:hypothetical protein